MATISAIRDGLKTVVEDISGLRVHDTIPAEIAPPAAVIIPERGEPKTVSGGRDRLQFRIRLAVSQESTRTAQDLLDAYLATSGASSIRAKINATGGLGVAGVKAIWQGWENYGLFEWNGAVYFGADVLITVEN